MRIFIHQICFLFGLMLLVGCTTTEPARYETPDTPTSTAVTIPTATRINTATTIAVNQPTQTATNRPTMTPSNTPTATMTHTATSTATMTHTATSTSTKTATPTVTPSPEPTATATSTPFAGNPDEIVAFVNVNVVPMDREEILSGQTVMVYEDRIVEMGRASEIEVPAGAQQIDGANQYLMPGLADMHVHLGDEGFLLLFVANGITTVRNMSGTPRHLAWREEIRAGERLGPTIYTTGPIMDGYPFYWPVRPKIETPAEAERMVIEQKELGYDFIKVYDDLTMSAYNGVLMAAKKHNMPIMGHAPKFVDMNYLLTAGQVSVEHLLGYVEAQETDLPELIALTSEVGVWNCPTLVAFQLTTPLEKAQEPRTPLDLTDMPSSILTRWNISNDVETNNLTYLPVDSERQELTRALHEAGAPLLLGTDTPTPFVMPGFSIHEELRNLVEAGLTPYEALQTGTENAADFLNGLDEFGTIKVGTRADMILLEANPLEDVANVKKRVGVMLRGEWLSEETLQQMLNESR